MAARSLTVPSYIPSVVFVRARVSVWPAVFGSVVEGMEVVKAVEKVGSQTGATTQKVVIEDAGQIAE
jgi:cyclophilin family peptidyl-prolyl cis-trans isomerase